MVKEISTEETQRLRERSRLIQEAQRLKKEGLTIKQVAERMKLSEHRVSYYLYGAVSSLKKEDKGEKENGHIKLGREVCVGIAYSETERFISLLGERLGVPTKLLRQRLSELLGHSSLR